MSLVAEFARQLHESESRPTGRPLAPLAFPRSAETLHDVRVVIFDVYGTLVNYWRPEFSTSEEKRAYLDGVFRITAERFGMTRYLDAMNPADPAGATLRDFYHGLIALDHEKSLRRGVEFPEVRIERIWLLVLMMLKRHGYRTEDLGFGDDTDTARCVAYFYNFHALGRGLFPGVVEALRLLREKGMRLGIVSNAQFYTPVDLTLFVRDQSADTLDDYLELFDTDLIFLSYEYGVAKPNQVLFGKLYDALYELHVLPSQTVFVGNDLVADVKPAHEAGMLTAFYTGDRDCAFTHGLEGDVAPDMSFESWRSLPERISFFEKKES